MISQYSNLVSPETISLTPLSSKTTTTKNTIKNDQRSPNYLALYGLRETPFAQEIDDRFFFLDTEQAQRLSLLHNLIQDPRMFLHLKGASGVGKS
ncbi:MAG: hypothetical protein ACC656_15840, partial [Candidatus Heimdallarchaeota archaeon]